MAEIKRLRKRAHCLGNALALSAFKLASQQVAKPPLQQWYNTTQEEQPYTPHRCPEAHTRTLAHRACVEAVVHQMLQVLQQTACMNATIFSAADEQRHTGCLASTYNCSTCSYLHHATFTTGYTTINTTMFQRCKTLPGGKCLYLHYISKNTEAAECMNAKHEM